MGAREAGFEEEVVGCALAVGEYGGGGRGGEDGGEDLGVLDLGHCGEMVVGVGVVWPGEGKMINDDDGQMKRL